MNRKMTKMTCKDSNKVRANKIIKTKNKKTTAMKLMTMKSNNSIKGN